MEDLTKKPLHEIGEELTRLENDIQTKIIIYNKMIQEVNNRFPLEITKETFKELEFKRKELKK